MLLYTRLLPCDRIKDLPSFFMFLNCFFFCCNFYPYGTLWISCTLNETFVLTSLNTSLVRRILLLYIGTWKLLKNFPTYICNLVSRQHNSSNPRLPTSSQRRRKTSFLLWSLVCVFLPDTVPLWSSMLARTTSWTQKSQSPLFDLASAPSCNMEPTR